MEKQPMNIKTRQCDVSAEGVCDRAHALSWKSFVWAFMCAREVRWGTVSRLAQPSGVQARGGGCAEWCWQAGFASGPGQGGQGAKKPFFIARNLEDSSHKMCPLPTNGSPKVIAQRGGWERTEKEFNLQGFLSPSCSASPSVSVSSLAPWLSLFLCISW